MDFYHKNAVYSLATFADKRTIITRLQSQFNGPGLHNLDDLVESVLSDDVFEIREPKDVTIIEKRFGQPLALFARSELGVDGVGAASKMIADNLYDIGHDVAQQLGASGFGFQFISGVVEKYGPQVEMYFEQFDYPLALMVPYEPGTIRLRPEYSGVTVTPEFFFVK